MIQAPDEEKRIVIAAYVLFTTIPTDRALAGWDGAVWADHERAEISTWVREETSEDARVGVR